MAHLVDGCKGNHIIFCFGTQAKSTCKQNYWQNKVVIISSNGSFGKDIVQQGNHVQKYLKVEK